MCVELRLRNISFYEKTPVIMVIQGWGMAGQSRMARTESSARNLGDPLRLCHCRSAMLATSILMFGIAGCHSPGPVVLTRDRKSMVAWS